MNLSESVCLYVCFTYIVDLLYMYAYMPVCHDDEGGDFRLFYLMFVALCWVFTFGMLILLEFLYLLYDRKARFRNL